MSAARRFLIAAWPWAVLGLLPLCASWYLADFPDDPDLEFPGVVRPTFNAYPPPAYRLAEPGDTLDRVAYYFAAGAVVLSAWAWLRERRNPAWPLATALGGAAAWHAITPAPLPDGWHGLGWREIFDPAAPWTLRAALAVGAFGLAALVGAFASRRPPLSWIARARQRGALGLLVVGAILVALRQVAPTTAEPAGFVPRWLFAGATLCLLLAVVRSLPSVPGGLRGLALRGGMIAVWGLAVFAGRGVLWYQRPIERLREIVPGRIYLSAMPTRAGLELVQPRHGFRTIVNLFPEHTAQRSPHYEDEVRFAAEHGIRLVTSPPDDPTGEAFVAETLDLARDPANWPILVHCHGSMDRSPAWTGLYRFVVQGWPLADALRELERHRGHRPKASVTLLYNRILPMLAPDRAEADPTARLLRANAQGTIDPALEMARSPHGIAEAGPPLAR